MMQILILQTDNRNYVTSIFLPTESRNMNEHNLLNWIKLKAQNPASMKYETASRD